VDARVGSEGIFSIPDSVKGAEGRDGIAVGAKAGNLWEAYEGCEEGPAFGAEASTCLSEFSVASCGVISGSEVAACFFSPI